MGYEESRTEQKKKKKKIWHWVFFCVSLLLVALCIFSAFVPPITWKYHILLPDVPKRNEGELAIHVLDAKHGDATVIELPNGEIALLGGGADDEESRENVIRFLYALDVEQIDYVIATGVHRDQCGALENVVEFFKVGKVYKTLQTGTPSGAYSDFIASANRKGIECIYPERCEFLYRSKDQICSVRFVCAEGEENSAIATMLYITYGEVNALIGGDMATAALEQLMQEDAIGAFLPWGISFDKTEIVKVASDVDEETAGFFLQWSAANDVVISCREEPSYVPGDELLSSLGKYANRILRTDQKGRITYLLNGSGYQINMQK